MKKIHFNLDSTKNYADVQQQIVAELCQYLPDGADTSQEVDCYLDDAINISLFIRQKADVFIGHNLSDKNYLWTKGEDGNPLINQFKYVFVPGEWLRQRLLKSKSITLAPEQIKTLGSPRVERLRRLSQTQSSHKPNSLRVLWAPLHDAWLDQDKNILSSYPSFSSYAEELTEHCEFISLPHPRNRTDKSAVTDALITADVVISDYSSVIYEAWALGKPVIFPRWLMGDRILEKAPTSAEAYIYANNIGYHPNSFEELKALLAKPLSVGNDVVDFMQQYLVNYNAGNPSKLLADVLRRSSSLDFDGNGIFTETDFSALKNSIDALPISASDLEKLNPGSARVSIQLLQNQLLKGCYSDFELTLESLKDLGLSESMNDEVMSLHADALLMQGRQADFQQLTQSWHESKEQARASYFMAKQQYFLGQPEQCIRLCLLSLQQQLTAEMLRLLCSSLHQLGYQAQAWELLRSYASRSPLFANLSVLALFASDLYELEEFFGVMFTLSPKVAKLPIAQLLNAIASKAAGQYAEANKVYESLFADSYLQPKSMASLPASSVGVFAPHIPNWRIPIENLSTSLTEQCSNRFVDATNAALEVLQKLRVECILDGIAHAVLRKEHLQITDALNILLLHSSISPNCIKAFREAGFYPSGHSANSQPNLCELQHINGVRIRLIVAELQQSTLYYQMPGIQLRLAIEKLTQVSYREFSVHEVSTEVQGFGCLSNQWLLSAMKQQSNELSIQVNEPELWQSFVYALLARARFSGDDEQEELCIFQLQQLGVHAVGWAKHIGTHYQPTNLPARLSETKYILHIGDGIGAAFHIDLWHQYCEEVDPNLVVAIRSKPLFELIRKTNPELNAVYIKAGLEAEWLVNYCPNLVGVLYVSNTGNVVHFIRFPHLQHIFLGHGDSEKSASCHKFFRVYDEVWTAGQAHIDRFKNSGLNFSNLTLRVGGRPTLRSLMAVRDNVLLHHKFLYLPTWEGFQSEQNYSSLELAVDFIPAIAKRSGKAAAVKLHPWTGSQKSLLKSIPAQLETQGKANHLDITVHDKEKLAADLMKESDCLIADISSVVTDYLCTGRPIFLFIPEGRNLRMSSSNMTFSDYCYIFSNKSQLESLFEKVIINGNDDLAQARYDALQYYIHIEKTQTGAFEQELRNCMLSQPKLLTSKPSFPTLIEDSKHGVIVGHRGAKGLFPENSMAGFKYAIQSKLDAVELDVHLSKDEQLVVMHDAWLERTTGHRQFVSELSLHELQALKLLDCNEPIPTLAQVLELFQNTAIELHIEIKSDQSGKPYPGINHKLISLLEHYGVVSRCVVTSFSVTVLQDLRNEFADLKLLLSANNTSVVSAGGLDNLLKAVSCLENCMIAFDQKVARFIVQQDNYQSILKHSGVWVVNKKEDIEYWLRQGVRQITTDRPDIACKVRDKLKDVV